MIPQNRSHKNFQKNPKPLRSNQYLLFNFLIFISTSSKHRNFTLFNHHNIIESYKYVREYWRNIISLRMNEQDFHSVRQNSQPVQT